MLECYFIFFLFHVTCWRPIFGKRLPIDPLCISILKNVYRLKGGQPQKGCDSNETIMQICRKSYLRNPIISNGIRPIGGIAELMMQMTTNATQVQHSARQLSYACFPSLLAIIYQHRPTHAPRTCMKKTNALVSGPDRPLMHHPHKYTYLYLFESVGCQEYGIDG